MRESASPNPILITPEEAGRPAMNIHTTGLKRGILDITTTTLAPPRHCTPFALPSNGVLSFADSVITLTADIVFQPECTGANVSDDSAITGTTLAPFYASTTPQMYVLAAATVIAWILVVMLVITPRTSFIGSPGTIPGFGSRRGIIGGATGGGANMIGVGSRPWLQKIAALTVAIALTIATTDATQVARTQYYSGLMDADALRDEVLGSVEIRVTRVISDVFVWLAQVQTLIRLFPRHKEKVLIKWIGFALIIFDSTFSCLDSFYVQGAPARPRNFQNAISALSYLFELALGLLYAAWVLYYAATKRKYAFYHAKMRNICLIALLSMIAVLTPVVFFVTDVSNQEVASWGDYFRWVGAAAASVVVWEWVERIEALERDEKKDGILGREVFDGDEMLDITPSEEAVWYRGIRGRNRSGGPGNGVGGLPSSALEHGLSGVAQRLRGRHQPIAQHFPLGRTHSSTTGITPDLGSVPNADGRVVFASLPKPEPSYQQHQQKEVLGCPTPPHPVASPISRGDTTSAASTVYVVRYDDATDIPHPVRRAVDANGNTAQTQAIVQQQDADEVEEDEKERSQSHQIRKRSHNRWQSITNPFKRKRASPPAEIQAAASNSAHAFIPSQSTVRWGPSSGHTANRERTRNGLSRMVSTAAPTVTVIPAPERGSHSHNLPPLAEPRARDVEPSSIANDAHSGSTTLTANSGASTSAPVPSSRHRTRHDRDAHSLPSPSPSAVSPPPVPSPHFSPPPRADDISPVPGSTTPTVIPAPRRSPPRVQVTAPLPPRPPG